MLRHEYLPHGQAGLAGMTGRPRPVAADCGWTAWVAGPFFLVVSVPSPAVCVLYNTYISVRHTLEFVVLGEGNAGNRSGDALHLILSDCRTIAKACVIHSDPAHLSICCKGFKIMR